MAAVPMMFPAMTLGILQLNVHQDKQKRQFVRHLARAMAVQQDARKSDDSGAVLLPSTSPTLNFEPRKLQDMEAQEWLDNSGWISVTFLVDLNRTEQQ
jgi:type II secretory pathway pseudopilin PulG